MEKIDKLATLRTYYPEYLTTGGLFTRMPDAPWVPANVSLEMDMMYFGHHSGRKFASEFVRELSTDGVLDQQKLATAIWSIFGKNWQRLWDVFTAQYEPIENYNMQEVIERQRTGDHVANRKTDTASQVDGTESGESTSEKSQTTSDKGIVSETGEVTGTTSGTNSQTTVTTDKETTTTQYGKVTSREANASGTTDDDTTTQYGRIVNTKGSSSQTESSTDVTEYGHVVQTDSESDLYAYGFNSAEKVPTNVTIDTSKETNSGTDKTTHDGNTESSTTGNESQSGSDTVTRDISSKNEESGKEELSGSDTITRNFSGNVMVNGSTSGSSTDNTTLTRNTTNEGTASGTDTVNSSGKTSSTGSENVMDDLSENEKENEEIITSRRGNIGVTTSQQMLEQDINLWKWNFYEQVFMDCDRVLTLSVFC